MYNYGSQKQPVKCKLSLSNMHPDGESTLFLVFGLSRLVKGHLKGNTGESCGSLEACASTSRDDL